MDVALVVILSGVSRRLAEAILVEDWRTSLRAPAL